jgi:glutamyl/glutaminyl-tRNA synthetase
MQVEALKEFILSQGASLRVVDMEWDKFWATNKKIIDPTAGRYSVVSRDYYVPVELSGDGLPLPVEYRSAPLHPQNKNAGTKIFQFGRRILLEGGDVEMCKEGEEITLMKWGNAIIRSIEKNADGRVRISVFSLSSATRTPAITSVVFFLAVYQCGNGATFGRRFQEDGEETYLGHRDCGLLSCIALF